jgi:uncharacterized membrane protein YGL010W
MCKTRTECGESCSPPSPRIWVDYLAVFGMTEYGCSMLGNRSWESWISKYSESHQHPLNRLTHTFGIPMILVSLPMMLGGIFWRPVLWAGIAMFVAGWALQFLGHAVEGKPPEFFSDWRFLLVGTRWWAAKMRGKV